MKFDNYNSISFYVAKNNKHEIYAEYTISINDANTPDVKKLVNIDDEEFKSFLRLVIFPTKEDPPTVSAFIQEIKDNINVYGCNDTITVKVRTAGKLKDSFMEYALYNGRQEIIEITPDGYRIVNSSRHKFIKRETSGNQVKPEKSKKNLLELLKPYINATIDTVILFIVWLVQSFCEGNHSALIITAERGSGKSTLTKQIQQIVDPSRLSATSLQRKSENLFTMLTNAYVVSFDNTRQLDEADSDALCIAVTGGTYAKREAYTTNQLAIFDLHNVVVLNGIDVIPSQSDLAERCMLMKLKSIDEEARMTDSEISEKFNRELPLILDGIFNTLAKAMGIIKTLNPKRKPRMAEAYLEMLAIAVALGITEEKFEKIYFKNIEQLNKARANSDLVYAVREFMENFVEGRSIEGKVSEIYSKIRANFSGNKHILPGSASQFSRKMNTERNTFSAVGLTVNLDDTPPDGTHIKIIKNK